MKSFLNYFASKMTFAKYFLKNMLQFIYLNILFCTLQQFLEIIHFYTTGQIIFPFGA